jgi:precorrin-2 dehydrogenase/sirohydrochlorin ferrochelatase
MAAREPRYPRHYPVNLLLRGRRCLVVGGGRVAAQKVRGLLDAEADVHVIALDVDEAIATLPGVMIDRRAYRAGDVAGHRIVVAATNDPNVNHAVAAEAEAADIWVNVADDPDHCTFTLPSRVRRGPVLVTFSTAGTSPALSTWLRRRFEDEIGPEYEVLAGLLAEARDEMRARGESTEGRGWQQALDSGMLELVRQGNLTEAKERLQACLSSSSD